MVGVKILIDVKEYERLKKCEDSCKKNHERSDEPQTPNNKTTEQSGSGRSDDERFREICREEMKRMHSSDSVPENSLVTTQAGYIPPITILDPRSTPEVRYEKVSPADTNDLGHGHEKSVTEENDDPWYYIGPLLQ